MIMSMTPHEALDKNKGKKNLQFERAVRDLIVDVEKAIEDYTGNPVYIGLPGYLQYKAEEESANRGGMSTLEAVDRAMDARFGPAGWNASIMQNKDLHHYWVKLRDKHGS
jgi:hypothetical protein